MTRSSKSPQSLLKLVRQANKEQKLYIPGRHTNTSWPVCLTCGREPHKVLMDDKNRTKIIIRAWCTHKGNPSLEDKEFEDWIVVDVPFGADRNEHIGMAFRNGRFFDPAEPPK